MISHAARGDAAGARRAIAEHGDGVADATLPDGTTALHAAALGGEPACVDVVLDACRDADELLEASAANGLTAAHVAARADLRGGSRPRRGAGSRCRCDDGSQRRIAAPPR